MRVQNTPQDIKSLLQQPQGPHHHHHHHFTVYPEFQLTGRNTTAAAVAAESLTDKQHVAADTVSSHNLAFHIENLIQKKHQHHQHQQQRVPGVGEVSQEEIVSSSGVHNNNEPHTADDQLQSVESKPKLIIINDEDDSNNSSGGSRR